MGAKDSKQCCISYEDALKRVLDGELRRLRDAFKRASNLNGIITRQAFIKEVLGEFVPLKLAEHIFQACGGTSKGITFRDLLCGLVLLTRGSKDEKIKFIFSLYANEAGTHVAKDDMVKLVQACDGGFVSEAVADCFVESERVTFEEFREWLHHHEDATSLTRWLLSTPCTMSLSNDLEMPTFYQTLAGVTHLEETDISELEKRYWVLKTHSWTGKFDLDTLIPLVSPPVPLSLCEGIFNAFDENRDGHVDFKEMACGISACCRGPLIERQKFCFKVFDQDRDGVLSPEEVVKMVRVLLFVQQEGKASGDEVRSSDAEVDRIVGELLTSRAGCQEDDIVTLDQYLVWSLNQTLPFNFLNLLFQVCHIIFGLRPATKEQEGEIVRSWLEREERQGMRVGQFWHLIAMDWWHSWNEYIDYQNPGVSCSADNLKRSNRLQRKIHESVAHSSLEDSAGNVILSSITSLHDDGGFLSRVDGLLGVSSFAANGGFGLRGSSESSGRNTAVQASPETPTHSPGMQRRSTFYPPQRPPSIDNTSLVVPNALRAMILTGEGGKLKRSTILTRGRDFELVPESVWRALSQWYGGSPPLARQVILPRNGCLPELELYPITLRLFRHQVLPSHQPANSWSGVVGSVASSYAGTSTANSSQIPAVPKRYLAYLASFSRIATLKQVFDFLCTRLRLRPDDTRLWLYRDDNNLFPLEDEDSTLEKLGLEDNEQILIEVRNKDLTWPEEMSSLLNAKLDQRNQGPTERGATGLNNLGNTCFMNAALQCVSNTQPLTLYFITNKHLYELNRINPLGMKGHIARRYGDLVRDLWSGTSRTIAPLKLRWTIGKYAPRFNGFQQHDSQELLAFLMDGLHEDLNRVHEKPYVELKDSDGRPDEEVAAEAWENHVLRNRSIVVDLFHGQLQSTVTCKVCGHTSVRFDPFNYLSLPLPMESCVHLEVVVIRLDGSIPMKYGLRLNHDDRYSVLKHQLGTLCTINPQQLLIAEVAGALIKVIPNEEQKVRSVMGGSLYAYELPLQLDSLSDEDVRLPKEPQTFTQIQRMAQAGLGPGGKRVPGALANGDASKSFSGNGTSRDVDSTKSTFAVGDLSADTSAITQPPTCEVQHSAQVQGHHLPSPWNTMVPGVACWTGSSGPPSMTSSLVSNSSTADLAELNHRNFVIAYHRKMIRQDVYFLSSQKSRPALFGLPLVLPCHDLTTHQDLYQLIWTQVARLVSPLPPSEASAPNHAQDCDDSLGYEYPFTLKAIQKDGMMCAWCPWYRFCRGCRIECCDADFNFCTLHVAIDWEPTALHLRYQSSQERLFVDHDSVAQTQRQQTEPINLHDCLEAFTKEEHLGEEEKYYCSKCKQHQLASKKLQIWRLPPILIVHLKRFQLLNGRWVKSHKIVKFPFTAFNPAEYLSPIPREAIGRRKGTTIASDSSPVHDQLERDGTFPNGNAISPHLTNEGLIEVARLNAVNARLVCRDRPWDFHQHKLQKGYDPFDVKYNLYALACHSGILGGGHYVSYACNPNNRWYCYNDSSCKEVQLKQIDADSAYMLFYEREGIDYSSYLPDIEGKVPDTKDIDEEFESEFRRICCIQ